MTSVIEPPALDAAVAETKAYLRVEGAHEDATIARLTGSATGLCEAFTGRRLMAREATELIPVSPAWRRLLATPVTAILGVEGLPADGAAFALPADAFATDIDAHGDGWVRVLDAGAARRARVRFEAGLAAEWDGLPEPLRQGIVRLVVHLFTYRDDRSAAAPPTAVTALWRPWRRIRLG